MKGVTKEDLKGAHAADVAIQGEQNAVFKSAWADPEAGVVYCPSEAPSADAGGVFMNVQVPPDHELPVRRVRTINGGLSDGLPGRGVWAPRSKTTCRI
jgi:hypothetical protein